MDYTANDGTVSSVAAIVSAMASTQDASLTERVERIALAIAAGWTERLVEEHVAIVRIPAQTGHEVERGKYLSARWRALGIDDAHFDSVNNVVGRIPGNSGGPRLLMEANMDTIYEDADCEPRREGDRLVGPGVWMNASGITTILGTVAALREAKIELPGDLIVAATVGEEAGGRFRGMRQLVDDWGGRVDAILSIGNIPGSAHHRTLCRVAHEVTVRTGGGHSYGNLGVPSAVHVLIDIAQGYLSVALPDEPKTSTNVGVFRGGDAPNSIASHAVAVFETRSPDPTLIARVEETLRLLVSEAGTRPGVQATLAEIDRSPFGMIEDDHPLVQIVYESHRRRGLKIFSMPVNCDADVALAAGIPTVVHGGAVGGFHHSPREFLESGSLVTGVQSLLTTVALFMERYQPPPA
jgi:acetylornithine deacetylase/succinyl-diaminopimelate desuccinylase-like protein